MSTTSGLHSGYMSDAELKPTIENPFAKKVKRVFQPPFSLDRKTAASQNKGNPIPDTSTPLVREKVEPEYDPGYFVSTATKRYISGLVTETKITRDELPLIYEFAQLTATIFKRQPTISDFELAVQFHDLEGLRDVAQGKEKVTIERKDNTGAPINPREATKIWQQVAGRVLDAYEIAHPEAKPVVEATAEDWSELASQ